MSRAIEISIVLMLSLILLAQLAFIPILLSLTFFCMMLALVWQYRRKNRPSKNHSILLKRLRLLLVIISLVIIYLHYQTFLGVEAGMAVLATFLYAKALESQKQRDLIILFNFALFVSAGLFLYSQSMWMAILALVCLTSCFMGLYRLQTNQFQSIKSTFQHLKVDVQHILKVIGLALPIFIVLFLFFPRLPPLWQVPIATSNGVTGMSEQMSPGDIAQLSQSSALAFRILGDLQHLPSRQNLYWRAMVLDQYNGTTWTRAESNQNIQLRDRAKEKIISVFDYQYLAADNHIPWIMALDQSLPTAQSLQLHQDGSITPIKLIQRTQPLQLQWLGTDATANLVFQQQHNLAFIQKNDLKAQQLAQQIFKQSQQDPTRYIENILKWYQQNHFSYSLTPGKLSSNRIDQFLFQSKIGFCEHYASSFTMLMRYVGIPARVVVGYQGGQWAPDRKSWEVRQLDAHAWSEVYINGRWQRYDPTFMIAPQRIEQGMQNYISEQHNVLGDNASSWRYQHYSIITNISIWRDYANYQWQSKILGYDAQQQNKWLAKLGMYSSYWYAILLTGVLVFLAAIYWMIFRWGMSRNLSIVDKAILTFTSTLNVEQRKLASETFQQWMLRLSEDVSNKDVFAQASVVFQKIVYLEQKDSETLSQFKCLLKECATELKKIKNACQHYKK